MDNNYLSHYGVKGMRWGTRRAYNKYIKLNDQYKHAKKVNAPKSVISSLNVEKQKAAAKYATKQSHDINISKVNKSAYDLKAYNTKKEKYTLEGIKWKKAQQYGEQKLSEVLKSNRDVKITGIRYRNVDAKVDRGRNVLRRLGAQIAAYAISTGTGIGIVPSKHTYYRTIQNKYKYIK